MTQQRRLVLSALAAVLVAALAAPTAAAAPAPPPSGKLGGHPENPSAGSGPIRNVKDTGAECPNGIPCRVAPAAYAQDDPSDPTNYGNYDLANRPADGLAIRFVVVHDTESSYDSTIAEFQNPFAYVSAHYVIRSADGLVTQMVPTQDVAWHAGNWYVNTHAVGIENEGVALQGAQWYTNKLYDSLARLTRYLADRFGIPLDREHVVGHDQVPAPVGFLQPYMHWDPGPYFDWAHFMALVGAPIVPRNGDGTGRVVTIDPSFATNEPVVTGCGSDQGACPTQPANFVYLHTAPSASSPLVSDQWLVSAGVEPNGVGTTLAWDWGDKAVTGQSFAVAGRQGDWLGVWYGGQEAWLYDPQGAGSVTIPGSGTLVTPKPGLASIPVYGRAYPSSESTATLGYTIPAGQVYVAKDLVTADHYVATTFDAPSTYRVVTSPEQFYEISFNHRFAFVRASDVQVVG